MPDLSSRSHRELELLDALRRLGGSARSTELAKTLAVSEETVRRTIKALSKSGAVARVYGGAYMVGTQNDPSFFRRMSEHSQEKRDIAGTVATQVRDGMAVFLDVGSTTAFVAEELRDRANLTVATNSIGVAQTLVNKNGNRVFLLGGEMQSDERGAFGFVTERQARRFAFDLAILSADGVSPRAGFMHLNAAEADLAAVVASCSEQVLMALDHFKFDRRAPHCALQGDAVDILVSDRGPVGKLDVALRGWGVDLRVARKAAK